MKNTSKLSLLLTLCISFGIIVFGCASTPTPTVETETVDVAGTKWIAVRIIFGMRDTLEFVDHVNCIYTSLGTPREFTYSVTGNKITLSNKSSYVMQGDTLTYEGAPFFTRE